jgi:mannose-1-phosphate guanylyltransferase/mannose-6-phosphate isomerase
MSKIRPVILCGGVGTRLWPVSRSASPKQFQRIDADNETTFFQATVQRHRGDVFDPPLTLVNGSHIGYVVKQLREIQQSAEIIVEPLSRNTGPALAAAALRIASVNPDQPILSLPSDHLISGDFNGVVEAALPAAEEGYIVVFGIKPTYPETGYGYILNGGRCNGWTAVNKVGRFVEKPPIDRARELIALGEAYWASGISLFKAGVLIAEFERHAPDILDCVERAIVNGIETANRIMLAGDDYAMSRSVSCEYAVYEKSDRMALAPADVRWDDVGAWESLHRLGEKNSDGNVTTGDVLLLETSNSFIRSERRLVTVIGLSDLVVVDTEDALLIADRAKTQSVKTAVEMLARINRREVVEHAERVEDWGTSKRLAEGPSFSLRHLRIAAEQQAALPFLDAEIRYLTLVQGEGEVLLNDSTHTLLPGVSILADTEKGCVIVNLGKGDLHVIEMIVESEREAPLAGLTLGDDLMRQLPPAAHA